MAKAGNVPLNYSAKESLSQVPLVRFYFLKPRNEKRMIYPIKLLFFYTHVKGFSIYFMFS